MSASHGRVAARGHPVSHWRPAIIGVGTPGNSASLPTVNSDVGLWARLAPFRGGVSVAFIGSRQDNCSPKQYSAFFYGYEMCQGCLQRSFDVVARPSNPPSRPMLRNNVGGPANDKQPQFHIERADHILAGVFSIHVTIFFFFFFLRSPYRTSCAWHPTNGSRSCCC